MAQDLDEKQKIITYSVDVYITLGLITLFAYYSLQLISPFISVLLWAIILAVAIHPLYEGLRVKIGGKGGLASLLIGLIGLTILLVPAVLVAQSMLETLGDLSGRLREGDFEVPPPPDSIEDWPLIGGKLYAIWSSAHDDLRATLAPYAPQIERTALSMLEAGAGIAIGVLQFALSIIFAAVFLSFSEALSGTLSTLANRIASERGRSFVSMAGATIRNVSRGILGVAVIQGGLASIGILAAGLPFAGFLAALTVAACIVQVPILVIVPTIIYVWSADTTLVAILYTAFMVPVLLSDNVLKPVLMARGLETPMVVILIGVIGGTVSAGIVGLFIGPVVLALFYKMIEIWVGSLKTDESAEASPPPDATG